MKRRMVVLVACAVAMFGIIGGAFAGEEIAGAAGYYLADDGVWSESNGLEGLQRSATDTDGDGNAETPADSKVL